MPTKSNYPDFEIPNVGLWDFLFERKQKGFPDDQVIAVDADTERSYTFAQVKQTAMEFGKGLRSLWDWQKNDVLGLYSPNSIDTPCIVWGCHFAGGILSPANPGYTAEELAFQLRGSGAKALVTQLPFIETALKACKEVGIPEERIILIGNERDSSSRFKQFTSIRNISGTSRYRRVTVNPADDLAFIVYSSGTTGQPKGVMLTHRNIVSNVLQTTEVETDLTKDDTLIAFLPFFHIYGLTVILHQTFFRGNKMIVLPKFELEAFCRLVQKHKITSGHVVPPVVLGLAKHPIVDKYDLSSLRMLNSGAAPLTKELLEAMYKRIKVPCKQGYGLSETSPTTHLQPWADWDRTIGSVGHLLPLQTAKFVDAEEKEVPAGQTGEFWVKGPNVFKGYLNNVEGTKNALTEDGYFKTGDVGYQDKDGNFYITDRIKELIKYKGFQVPPAELEGLLQSHEKIDDVAVLGVFKEEQATEVPRAFVVLKKGVQANAATEKDIVQWLASKVASHKRLRGGCKFVDEIPKSASGKILRRLLKDKYKDEGQKTKAKL